MSPTINTDSDFDLTVAISAHNRPDVALRAILSLTHLSPFKVEVRLTDDCSTQPLEPYIKSALPDNYPFPVIFKRNATNLGYIPTRNQLNSDALAPIILSLDDDAYLAPDGKLDVAIRTIQKDKTIGAIALAHYNDDGTRKPDFMQPSKMTEECYISNYYGYGHLIRKEAFLKTGKYREEFYFFREEIDMCKRMLDIGYSVVYLPDSYVFHSHDTRGRNEKNHLRYNARNSILDAMYNEPFPMMMCTVPYRVIDYIRWRKVPQKHYGFSDKGGVQWLIKEILLHSWNIFTHRKPLKYSTYRKWKQLKKEFQKYEPN